MTIWGSVIFIKQLHTLVDVYLNHLQHLLCLNVVKSLGIPSNPICILYSRLCPEVAC